MPRLRPAARALAACLLAGAGAAAQAEAIYKCVDERGVTNYTESPRPECRGRAVDIRPSAPLSGKAPAPLRDLARDNADFKRRLIEREQLEEKEKAQLAAQDLQCARDRHFLMRLETSGRIVTGVTPSGEQAYMDDATRDRQLAELRGKLAACR